jgi:hypothetical protein
MAEMLTPSNRVIMKVIVEEAYSLMWAVNYNGCPVNFTFPVLLVYKQKKLCKNLTWV